jgi:RHS repeat-associated protein
LNDLITLNTRRQITNTYYDVAYAGFSGLSDPLVAKNLRSRVSYTTYTEGSNPALYDQATFYSYDIHGNVDTLLQDYRTGLMNDQEHRFKKLVYQYDLISGKVNHVAYQSNKADQFYHRYMYDAENRVTQAQTSADSIVWERDAMYSYLMHGPLARTILGQQKVQGQDYAYTLQGWLKAINGVGTTFEVGNDGTTITAANQYVARDAYSLMLHYNSSDYSSILNTCYCVSNQLTLPATHTVKNLYNGNIAGMSVSIPKINRNMNSSTYLGSLYYNYKYDQLNRLKGMDAYTKSFISLNTLRYDSVLSDYKEQISYDANGNILKYQRNGTTLNSMQVTMDKMNYKYYAGTNQLRQVTDSVNSTYYSEDIDNQSDTSNYVYDAIGNLVKDKHEGIDSIKWNVYGKIMSIHKNSGTNIYYTYDAGGNRISKKVTANGDTTTTWYARDATGNVMSVYRLRNDTTYQDEIHLYGSSRIGILKPERILNLDTQYGDTSVSISILGTAKGNVFRRRMKFFELGNHLQNVLVSISDKKIGVDANSDGNVDYYNADVITANDYYPFGMVMPGRKYNTTSGYRYGFNGKEKDTEGPVQYDYGFRIYDPRLGRFKSVDPLTKEYPELTPYQFASNRPVDGIDRDGLEFEPHWASTVPHKIMEMRRKYSSEQIAKWDRQGLLFVGGGLLGAFGIGYGVAAYTAYGASTILVVTTSPKVIATVSTVTTLTARYGPDLGNFIYGVTTGDATEPFPTNTGSQSADVGAAFRGLFKAPVNVTGLLNKAGVQAAIFIKGTTGKKVAVIGQGMEKVRDIAFGLKNAEVFTPSAGALKEWDKLLADNTGKKLSDDVIKGTQMFKENTEWINKVKKEGYDVLDTGGGTTSTSYNMEKEVVYGKK